MYVFMVHILTVSIPLAHLPDSVHSDFSKYSKIFRVYGHEFSVSWTPGQYLIAEVRKSPSVPPLPCFRCDSTNISAVFQMYCDLSAWLIVLQNLHINSIPLEFKSYNQKFM
jgi:hypothetical protein